MSHDDAKAIKQRADIVDVARTLGIDQATYQKNILCPFHDDRTPSFRFYPPKAGDGGSFHCFSECGANDDGGDVFALVMRYRNIGFADALKDVARMVGYTLKPKKSFHEQNPTQQLFAAAYYAFNYYKGLFPGSPAETYLANRGLLTQPLQKKFGLGYAPPGNALLKAAPQRLHDSLLRLGLLRISDNGELYDLMRDRLIIPVMNKRGQVVAFGARDLSGHARSKYLNTPESEIFKKRDVLFNYGLASASQSLVIVEGYLDVLAMDQAGMTDAVATMGVALGRELLERLAREHDDLVFCFDSDKAGWRAAWRVARSAIQLTNLPCSFRFAFLPESCDPCDLVVQGQAGLLLDQVDQAITLSDFILREAQRGLGDAGGSIEARVKLVHDISMFLNEAPPGLFRDMLGLELAAITDAQAKRIDNLELDGLDQLEPAQVQKVLEAEFSVSINVVRRGSGVIIIPSVSSTSAQDSSVSP